MNQFGQAPTRSTPLMRDQFLTDAATPSQGVGGGMGGGIYTPQAMDPNGIVPINRVQPMANAATETQRLMENRLGTMPPSSFSGAGGGFVPVDRPGPVSPAANYGDRKTDQAYNAAPIPTNGRRGFLAGLLAKARGIGVNGEQRPQDALGARESERSARMQLRIRAMMKNREDGLLGAGRFNGGGTYKGGQ